MRIKNLIKQNLKKIFHSMGVEVTRAKNCTKVNFLGLKNYSFETIIDVGANTGQFAKEISKIYPNATIYCFEPLPEPFEELSRWADTMKGKVIPVNVAIGDKNQEQVEIFLHEDHTPSSSLLSTTNMVVDLYPATKKQKIIYVKQSTLDSEFKKIAPELKKEILIKMDVQGFEDRVISGGGRMFDQAVACIIEISLDTLYEDQASFKQLFLILDERGFSYRGNLDQSYAFDGHCVYIDAVFMKSQ